MPRSTLIALLAGLVVALPVAAADIKIDQIGQKFDPNTATLKPGDTIHFVNGDDVTHNINIIDSDDNADDKGLQKPGQEIVQKFDKAGTYMVKCAIHPRMKMTVEVK
jgi:plastocyanin